VINLLGTRISDTRKKELLQRIERTLSIRVNPPAHPRKSAPLWMVTANPEMLLKAYRDNAYRSILNQADVIVADGVGVVLAARLLYGARLERITGADLAEEILRLALRHHKKVFPLGGSAKVNQKAIENVTHYTLQATNVHGLGGEFTEEKAIKEIAKYQPDILFVALGSPKQEQFIDNLTKRLTLNSPQGECCEGRLAKPCIMMGIGGTIDFWARPSLRAPEIFQRIGLEWLWRLIRQPWRIKRILNAIIVFPVLAAREYFAKK